MSIFDAIHQPSQSKPTTPPWTVRRAAVPSALPPLTQSYRACWLDAAGAISEVSGMGPRVPLFSQAFSAVVRGTIVPTTDGPVAVEDLLPGMKVVTSQGPDTVIWIGSQTHLPAPGRKALYRIPAEALGPGRPGLDLMLGAGARILGRGSAVRTPDGGGDVLIPIGALADGMSVVEIAPISAVQTFHLGFRWHRTFSVNGLEIESVHPGPLDPSLGGELTDLFMSMFPHLSGPEDFGALTVPRLSIEELGALSA